MPPGGPLRLSDAQLAIARELGARSWPALVRDAQARAVARGERARTFVEWATSARREEAEALLALDPDIAGQGLDAALVLGDVERVTTALAGDAGVVRRAFGARGWEPLLYVTPFGLPRRRAHRRRSWPAPACCWRPVQTPTTADRCAARPAPTTRPAWSCCSTRAPGSSARWRWPTRRSADGCARRGCCSSAAPATGASARTRCSGPCTPRRRRRWCGCSSSTARTSRRPSTAAVARPTASPCAAAGQTSPSCSPQLGARRRAEPLDELIGACLTGDGATARRLAAEHPDAARLLRSGRGGRPGRLAADGRREAVEILLDLGVPVDARGPGGLTALQEATACEDADLVALLLERGADPDKRAPRDRPVADEPPYGELGWAAEQAYLRLLATSPLAESRPCGDGVAVVTGVESNTENGVVCSRLDGDVDATIADTLRWLAGATPRRSGCSPTRSRRPTCASASSRPGPAPNARPWSWAPCSTTWPSTIRRRPGSRSSPCATPPRCARGRRSSSRPSRAARAVEVLASLGLGPDAPLQHRLARRDGEVVGAASFLLHGETVLGQQLAVVAPERRAGIGRALVQACAREATAAGARIAVVGPTPDTVAFYRLLGFALRAGAARPLVLPAAAHA